MADFPTTPEEIEAFHVYERGLAIGMGIGLTICLIIGLGRLVGAL